jgi:hypothetical protein|uniref:Uncharacterized protein n=1 Tax=Siphoviridae sp. ctNxi14 TaxID=2825475 RepID=A0A8S5VHA7_9CAUD|nr:MAG TPA: hypothetical protein [Siphoviridae sp. ctNxi14]
MKQHLDLKVDLENPDEARHTIDELVKMYEADKFKWTAEELAEAKHLAMKIMTQLCLDGYDITWSVKVKLGYTTFVSVFLQDSLKSRECGSCLLSDDKWKLWIAKCVCLCRATGRNVPAFIVKKAGECW